MSGKMKKSNSNSILLLLIIVIIVFSNFSCCTTSCLKRTIGWDEYIPSGFLDNTTIINSEEFKTLQQKYPIAENEIDSFTTNISPILGKWIGDNDSVFQGNSEIIAKLRINSKGIIDYIRTLNTFKLDTNRINILKENLKYARFKPCSDTMIQTEFS
jgi:hypothetical protein